MSSINGTSRSLSAPMSMSQNGGGAPRKMVIKPFKVQPKLPENFESATWEKLKQAIGSVYNKNASLLSKEELYRAVEDLCVHKLAANLYESLSKEIDAYIRVKVQLLASQTVLDAALFLSMLDTTWQDHCEQLSTIRNIFLYLDRSYSLQPANGAREIWDLGNVIFRKEMEQLPGLLTKIVHAMLTTIECVRQGEDNLLTNDSLILSRITHMLLTLQCYHTSFEVAFLEDSRRFFTAEGSMLLTQLDTAKFLCHVDRRIFEAVEMTTKCLDVSTKRSLLDIVEQHLLKPHVTTLLERGFKALMDDNRREDLRRMFCLFERVKALDLLKVGWSMYIRQMGESLMSNLSQQKSFVEDVLTFQERLEVILKSCFFNQELFRQALKSSFEHFLNINQRGAAEQVARYVDNKMRGQRGMTELEIEAKLDQVMTLFKYLHEKDIFEAFYKKHLSKRLLLGKSASYDLEKNMLAKLKAECGATFTSKLEGMFTDVELSRQCQLAFSEHVSPSLNTTWNTPLKSPHSTSSIASEAVEESSGGAAPSSSSGVRKAVKTELAIQLLTTGYWPTYPTYPNLILPPELTLLMTQFQQFYETHYQGRRLTWAHALERCVVIGWFPKKRHELEVSLLQALVLRCFNSADKLSFSDVLKMTGIEAEELKRTLLSLSNGMQGTHVLKKEPKGRDCLETDSFLFNAQFTNPAIRIKINTIQAKETAEEVEKTHEEVFRDREYQVDAAIVRIMKARKRLTHTLLISETMTQLKFPAQNNDIKKRIESLIEREYLERDPEDNSMYRYLA